MIYTKRLQKKYQRAVERYEQARENIYRSFKSSTALKGKIPKDAVTFTLGAKWCNYEGYCEPVKGQALLLRYERAKKVLKAREGQREQILRARRAKVEARRQAEHAIAIFALAENEHTEQTEYVGTLPAELGTLDPYQGTTQALWRRHLVARGKSVPDVPLIAQRCKNSERYKVLALGVYQGRTLAEWETIRKEY